MTLTEPGSLRWSVRRQSANMLVEIHLHLSRGISVFSKQQELLVVQGEKIKIDSGRLRKYPN